jgi:hypothetical protein
MFNLQRIIKAGFDSQGAEILYNERGTAPGFNFRWR